jgi:hypothetical protein
MSVASVLRDALQHAAARPAIGSPAPGGAAAVAGAVPSSVLDAVDGAVNAGLARIETLQVASARAAPAQLPVWMVELPMRGREGVDELRLRIAEESRGSGDGALQVWTAELLFTPAGLSSVHARISLAPHGVVTVLTTEDRATHEHMQGAIQDLSDLFAGAGLAVAAVHCRCAALPEMGPALPLSGLVSAQA